MADDSAGESPVLGFRGSRICHGHMGGSAMIKAFEFIRVEDQMSIPSMQNASQPTLLIHSMHLTREERITGLW